MCNNYTLTSYMVMYACIWCVCAFLLHQESPDLILGRWTPHFWGGSVTHAIKLPEEEVTAATPPRCDTPSIFTSGKNRRNPLFVLSKSPSSLVRQSARATQLWCATTPCHREQGSAATASLLGLFISCLTTMVRSCHTPSLHKIRGAHLKFNGRCWINPVDLWNRIHGLGLHTHGHIPPFYLRKIIQKFLENHGIVSFCWIVPMFILIMF
jgi:hypothetical protein